MGYANMLFATATVDETMADVIDRYRPLMVELAAEIYDVATREGVRVEPSTRSSRPLFHPRPRTPRRQRRLVRPDNGLAAARARSRRAASGATSRYDGARPRSTCRSAGDGAIGAGHGLAMPLTNRLVAIIHDLETGRRQMSWENVDELDRLRRITYGEAAW